MAVFPGTDRFEIRRCLGSGSFGTVYEAFDRERTALVALKLPHVASAQGLFLFKQEFRALAEVAHVNLATLFELLADGDRWFFTMELVDGVHLLDHLKPPGRSRSTDERPTGVWSDPEDPPAEPGEVPDYGRVRRVMRQLAEGLVALHAGGLLHRDLKPSNVLVDRGGRVVILDFGLITDMEETSPGEPGGPLAGTPAYMAPEQIAGHPATEASDWYSVGVLLYQALTGQLPFPDSHRAMFSQKLQMDPLEPRLLEPGTPVDLGELCTALLRRDPSARPQGPEVLDRLREHPDVSRAPMGTYPRSSSLVGREEELAVLLEGFRLSRARRTVVALLRGDSGTGKSSLVHAFRREVRKLDARTVVLLGRCYEQETVPFKALDSLVDALSQHLKRLPSGDAAALLPRGVQALARLFPVLDQVPSIREMPPEAGEPEPQALRRRAFAALGEILGRMAERGPVVLIIDDIHWGDLDSAILLSDLLRGPEPPRIMLTLACRSDEARNSPVMRELIPELVETATILQDVELRPLAAPEARGLARKLLGEGGAGVGERAAWIASESGGSPFFVQELAQYSRLSGAEGPRPGSLRLDDYLRLRLEALSGDSRRILRTLAIAGAPLEWEILQAASGAAAGSIAPLASLRAGHLVRMRTGLGRGLLEVYHDRIRVAVVASMSGAEVRETSLALARVLEARAPEEAQALARHFEAGGIPAKACEYAVRAAVLAEAALAFEQAAAFYRKAIRLKGPSDPALLKRLGDALATAGLSADSAEAYLEAAGGSAGPEAGRLRRRAAEERFRSGDIEAGLAILTEVLARAGVRLPGGRAATLCALLWLRLRLKLRGLDFKERAEARVPADQLERVDMLWALAMGLGPVDVLRAAGFQARQLLLTLEAGEPLRVARALAHEAVLTAAGGNRFLRRTQALLDRTQALAARLGDPGSRVRALMAAGIVRMIQGRWRASADLLDEAEELLKRRCTGMDYELHLAQHHGLLARVVLGDLRTVRERLPLLLQEAREKGDLIAATNLRTSTSYILDLARDDPDASRRDLEDAIALWSRKGFSLQHYYRLVSRVNLEFYAGACEEADGLLRAAEKDLARSLLLGLQPMLLTTLELRARAALALAVARPEHRPALLRSAREATDGILAERTPYGGALALKLQAMQAVLDGRKPEALERLLRSEITFEACDMKLHAMVIRHTRGRLLGDAELLGSAEAWMKGQGIRAPGRFAAMHVPLPRDS